MKKQILIVTVFIAAILANVNIAFGQLSPGVTDPTGANQPIVPLTCLSGSEPLHPYPGVSYTYALDGTAGEETAANWTWWATKDPGFVTAEGTFNIGSLLTVASGDLVAVSADYGNDNSGGTNGTPSVDITWSANILAATEYQGDPAAAGTPADPSPTFVVGYAEGNNCADNIQVFEINPSPNFTIDIAAIDTATGNTMPWDDVTIEQCVDDVQSATYNTTSKELDMDYGHNVIYFEVAAANFVTDWTPTFQIVSGLAGDQTAVISMHASLADAQSNSSPLFTSSAIGASGMNTAIPTSTHLTATDPADVAIGVSVFVRVYIDNNTEESLTSSPFVLAVDAQDETETGIWDMEDDDCTSLTDAADQIDQGTITITPRPQLDDATTPETIPNPDAPVVKTAN